MEQLNDKWFRIAGIPALVVLLLLTEMPFFFPGRWDLFWKYSVASTLFTGLIWECARWNLIRIRLRWPGLENTGKRIVRILVSFLIIAGIGQLIMEALIDWLGIAPVQVFSFQNWLINVSISMFLIVLIASVYEAIYFFRHYKIALQRTEHLKKEQARQHLEALKNRVNPHFLFNSLTTLSALIGEDAPGAERFVDELAKVYRYLLRANRQQQTLLADELAFLKSYTFLLKTRLGPAFDIQVQVADSFLEKQLPPLTLQTLLDYLIRTQAVAPEKPLIVELAATENGLTLACPYQPKTIWADSGNMDWTEIAATFEQQTGKAAVQAIVHNRLLFRIPFILETEAAV